jgi:16S rRNA (cytosine1402-N4)-methyltransferase
MVDKIVHVPVLLDEVINALSLTKDEVYVDATFGLGGYTNAILSNQNCKVVAIDRDPHAKLFADNLKKIYSDRFYFKKGKFSELGKFLKELKIHKVAGIVFDLGVSSPQLDIKDRGFSFKLNGPLDMRMSSEGPTAEDFLDEVEETTLANIIYELGDEIYSRRIAKKIIHQRSINKIKTTGQLADIIRNAIPKKKSKIDLATKTFQAIRIYLNDEIKELEEGLIAAEKVLRPEGRLVVVSFHSIEDKIVKNFFYKCLRKKSLSRHLPELPKKNPSLEILTKKPILPSAKEICINKRSRSAKLRIAKRTHFSSTFGEFA